jgi:hypothetical protein
MKRLLYLLLSLLFYHCREAPRETVEIIPIEINLEDSMGLENLKIAEKYGFYTENPPAWMGTDLVMEDVVEGIEQNLITIQGLNLLDFEQEGVEKKLKLRKNREFPNHQEFINDDKSLLYSIYQLKNVSIQVKNIKKVEIRLDSIVLNNLDISSYKRIFPGSYSFRNLYGISETLNLAEIDSIATIDHVFLWSIVEQDGSKKFNGKLDIIYVNGFPIEAYLHSFPK